jgi:hypothetical protein
MTLSILPTVSELDMNQLYHVYRSARDDAKGAMPERRTFTTGISIDVQDKAWVKLEDLAY